MSGFTDAVFNNVLDAVVGTAAFVATVAPLKLRIETAAGTSAAAGTEATSYTPPTVTFAAAANKIISNNVALSIAFSAAQTVVAAAAWDSAGTPLRKLWGPLGSARTLAAGDSLAIANGALQMTGAN